MPKATQNLGREPDFWLPTSPFSAHHFGSYFLSTQAGPSLFRAGVNTEIISSCFPTCPASCLSGQSVGCPGQASGIAVLSDQHAGHLMAKVGAGKGGTMWRKLDGAPFFLCCLIHSRLGAAQPNSLEEVGEK